MVTSNEQQVWSLQAKVFFRFFFVYFLLYVIIKNNGAFPYWYEMMELGPNRWLEALAIWVGENILHLPYEIEVFRRGSGDKTYDYILIFICFVIAVIATVIWSLFSKRKNYQTLYYWLLVVLRFYIGLMLINYGLVKIVKLQFSDPSFRRLLQAYGESSPMGLAWTFLGFSKGYNVFMGVVEVLSGLLLFRRTMTLGALIAISALLNVMAVNYFYDVPVKVTSTHLFLISLFILWKDIRRIFQFFFTDIAVRLEKLKRPEVRPNWLGKSLTPIKILFLAFVLIQGLIETNEAKYRYGQKAPKPPLYGLYKITAFTINGDTIPPLLNHEKRWRYFLNEQTNYAWVYDMNMNRSAFYHKIDTVKQTIELKSYKDSTNTFQLRYIKTDSTLSAKTIIKTDTITFDSKWMSKKDFLLTSRGFHWITELPFNR